MRKNKKLLLGGLSVLTLVAAGSGAVSTFAWYSATNNASIKSSSAPLTTASAADPNTTVGTPLPLDITVARVDSNGTSLELGHYYSASEIAGKKDMSGNTYVTTTPGTNEVAAVAGFYHAYIDANSVVHYSTTQLKAEYGAFAEYSVTAKAQAANYTDETGQTWTNAQIAEAVKNLTVTVTVAPDTGSRATFYGKASSAQNAAPTAAGTNASYVVVSAKSLGGDADALKTDGSGVVLGYFSLYVEGVNPSGETTADSGAVSANFNVTVA